MITFFKNPQVYLSGMLILLLFALSNNFWECQSRFLYFSTEIGLVLFSVMVYLEAFRGKAWTDPPEPEENRPRPKKDRAAFFLGWSYGALVLVVAVYWIAIEVSSGLGIKEFFHRGSWYLYWLGVFSCSAILVRHAIRFTNLRALVMTSILMTYLLTTYEILLLSHGTGWKYNNTILGWVLGAPLDSILFVYPVAPALAILLYVSFTKGRNDMKAFWLLNLMLAPASILTEYLGIHVLKLWTIYNDNSVWPMGWTNFEEILYYVIAQFLAMALYILFDRGFSYGRPGVLKKS